MAHIDLNSDLGESFGPWPMGDDAAMLDIVTSANVACGFHAGDPAGILGTLRRAAERGVSVGAHVAYPDLVGFGRRNMDVASSDLRADVIYQIGALQALARVAGTRVGYVKPHGALYNTIAHDQHHQDETNGFVVRHEGFCPWCVLGKGPGKGGKQHEAKADGHGPVQQPCDAAVSLGVIGYHESSFQLGMRKSAHVYPLNWRS